MTMDDKDRDEKLQYDINRATATVFAWSSDINRATTTVSSLLSGKIDEYEYPKCEEILL